MDSLFIAIIWFVICVVFVVLEFVSSKYLLPIAMGAGVAGVATLFSLSIIGQIVVFAIVLALGYLLFKPNRSRRDRRDSRPGSQGRGYDSDDFID